MSEKLTFFVVDDQHTMHKLVAHFLREMQRNEEIPPYRMYEAGNGLDALEMLLHMYGKIAGASPGSQDAETVIVLCDVEMEPLSGIELVKSCFEHNALRNLNFIMMTDNPEIGLISEIGELGVTSIMVKPIAEYKLSELVQGILKVAPLNARYREAKRLIEEKEYEQALQIIAESAPKSAGVRWNLLRGCAYLGLNNAERAENEFRSAEIGAHIASVLALRHLVELYEIEGNTQKEIEALSELTQMAPNNLDRRVKLARLLTEVDRFVEAKSVLEALTKTHLNTEAQFQVARLFEKSGCAEEAAELRARTIKQNIDDYVICNRMAIELRRQGRHEQAEACYEEIIAVHPEQEIIWFNRGVNLSAWGRQEKDMALLERARNCFTEALQIVPGFSDATNALEHATNEIREISRARIR